MSELNSHVEFYKQSLHKADNEVRDEKENGRKSLKDVVGKAFENHRKRIWEHFGFEVSKDRYDALFNVDWSITLNGNLIAFEEDKGHYLDSCSLERMLSGFAKTVNSYLHKDISTPILIIHSFTLYSKFNDKKIEDLETRKSSISHEMYNKIMYTTLTKNDRLPCRK